MIIGSCITIFAGFILTMWYVNTLNRAKSKKAKFGFILTMWYVNFEKAYVLSLPWQSFILTMWYVNGNIGDFPNSLPSTFYINYVVCKYDKDHLGYS